MIIIRFSNQPIAYLFLFIFGYCLLSLYYFTQPNLVEFILLTVLIEYIKNSQKITIH